MVCVHHAKHKQRELVTWMYALFVIVVTFPLSDIPYSTLFPLLCDLYLNIQGSWKIFFKVFPGINVTNLS